MSKQFLRQSVHKKKRLEAKWRRPKGLQSKLRKAQAGHSKGVSSGYGKSKSEKGTVKGKEVVMVSSLKDLESIKSDLQVAIVASKLGAKKKIEILSKCKEAKIVVSNIRDVEAFIKAVVDKKAANKKRREAKAKAKVEPEKKPAAKKTTKKADKSEETKEETKEESKEEDN
ncbi:hypothetical protein JXM83_06530 [Candidatus Woesearchaeota archaeon]|nr:hypothetical protein [Candidatus Woesearchaeota archaeon]